MFVFVSHPIWKNALSHFDWDFRIFNKFVHFKETFTYGNFWSPGIECHISHTIWTEENFGLHRRCRSLSICWVAFMLLGLGWLWLGPVNNIFVFERRFFWIPIRVIIITVAVIEIHYRIDETTNVAALSQQSSGFGLIISCYCRHRSIR